MARMIRMAAAAVVFVAVQAALASPVPAGTVKGEFDLGPQKFQALKMTCAGEEDTVVTLKADKGATVQLQFFDADGREVYADNGDDLSVKITPKMTTTYRIKISNLSSDKPVHFTITAE